jgi:hypothetical protein
MPQGPAFREIRSLTHDPKNPFPALPIIKPKTRKIEKSA